MRRMMFQEMLADAFDNIKESWTLHVWFLGKPEPLEFSIHVIKEDYFVAHETMLDYKDQIQNFIRFDAIERVAIEII